MRRKSITADAAHKIAEIKKGMKASPDAGLAEIMRLIGDCEKDENKEKYGGLRQLINDKDFQELFKDSIKLTVQRIMRKDVELLDNVPDFIQMVTGAATSVPAFRETINFFDGMQRKVIHNILAACDDKPNTVNQYAIAQHYWIRVIHGLMNNNIMMDANAAMAVYAGVTSGPVMAANKRGTDKDISYLSKMDQQILAELSEGDKPLLTTDRSKNGLRDVVDDNTALIMPFVFATGEAVNFAENAKVNLFLEKSILPFIRRKQLALTQPAIGDEVIQIDDRYLTDEAYNYNDKAGYDMFPKVVSKDNPEPPKNYLSQLCGKAVNPIEFDVAEAPAKFQEHKRKLPVKLADNASVIDEEGVEDLFTYFNKGKNENGMSVADQVTQACRNRCDKFIKQDKSDMSQHGLGYEGSILNTSNFTILAAIAFFHGDCHDFDESKQGQDDEAIKIAQNAWSWSQSLLALFDRTDNANLKAYIANLKQQEVSSEYIKNSLLFLEAAINRHQNNKITLLCEQIKSFLADEGSDAVKKKNKKNEHLSRASYYFAEVIKLISLITHSDLDEDAKSENLEKLRSAEEVVKLLEAFPEDAKRIKSILDKTEIEEMEESIEEVEEDFVKKGKPKVNTAWVHPKINTSTRLFRMGRKKANEERDLSSEQEELEKLSKGKENQAPTHTSMINKSSRPIKKNQKTNTFVDSLAKKTAKDDAKKSKNKEHAGVVEQAVDKESVVDVVLDINFIEKLDIIEKVLQPDGWQVGNVINDEVVISKQEDDFDYAFSVKPEQFVSHDETVETFEAMLKAYAAVNPGFEPDIKTDNPELVPQWKEAYRRVYLREMEDNILTVVDEIKLEAEKKSMKHSVDE